MLEGRETGPNLELSTFCFSSGTASENWKKRLAHRPRQRLTEVDGAARRHVSEHRETESSLMMLSSHCPCEMQPSSMSNVICFASSPILEVGPSHRLHSPTQTSAYSPSSWYGPCGFRNGQQRRPAHSWGLHTSQVTLSERGGFVTPLHKSHCAETEQGCYPNRILLSLGKCSVRT